MRGARNEVCTVWRWSNSRVENEQEGCWEKPLCLCSRRGMSRGRDHWSGDGEEGRRQGALRRNAGVEGRGGALKEAGSMRD